MAHVGMFLTSPTLWNVAIYTAAWAAQIVRIFAEERLLRQDPAYDDYTRQVRFRLIPYLF
jgi:protein-S-isoprenylcysteine O-methyltransferase Ste14